MEVSDRIETLTKISSLNYKKFTVEDYQRGYKWTKQQVYDLLDDVKDFIENDQNIGKAYCLQPIVVIEKDENHCELVDGQQRLTTIFTIISYIGKCNFSINYNTRKESDTFLNQYVALNDDKIINCDWRDFCAEYPHLNTVDNYHLYHAYKYIHEWFSSKDHLKYKKADIFLERLGLIYYQPEMTNGMTPQKIFRNINSNKIELTNAELIKGILIINGVKEPDPIHELHEQLNIAKEWDKIENALHNDQLWYFLNPSRTYRNRIEFLFELYAFIYVPDFKMDREDPYCLFHALNNRNLNHVWNETVQIFNIITDWFDDTNLEMYHCVGYVIAAELFSINELIVFWNSKTKDSFLKFLIIEILNKVGDDEKIRNASYTKSRKEVTRILLLHNILSLRQKDETLTTPTWASRFRYDLFISEKWSLEHIHAQREAPRDSFENLRSWISSTVKSLMLADKWNEELEEYSDLKKMADFESIDEWAIAKNCDPKLALLIDHVTNFERTISDGQEDKHNIENLALLSHGMNSSIGNGYFNQKRAAIIEYDKKGRYLLPTTKNVFLKFYSTNDTNPFEWGKNDKDAYLNDISSKINNFRKEMN
tara:strand:- start:4829 stop:6613 length:1785 start_codon:yes stop_codon:yes gene_type:complete